jgi:hypothetical protein
MQLDRQSDLLLEVPVQHLPMIRWFKNQSMDLVFEMNKKEECIQFSIAYREQENHFNIEWDGNQIFFSQNENNLEQTQKLIRQALLLLQSHGAQVPGDLMENAVSRLSSLVSN